MAKAFVSGMDPGAGAAGAGRKAGGTGI